MNSWKLTLRSLRHHWKVNLAVAAGVATATAVLTGALLMGDSVRGSLRKLTLERLGPVDEALVSTTFFRQQLVEELAAHEPLAKQFSGIWPAIVLEVGLEHPTNDPNVAGPRAGGVQLYGCVPEFFQQQGAGEHAPGADEIMLNQPTADALQVQVGDSVTLRLPEISDVPRESALGQKSETVRGQPLKVSHILQDETLSQFGLRPNQQEPRNAFVSLAQLQNSLDLSARKRPLRLARANAIFVAGPIPDQPPPVEIERQLTANLRPKLDDYGLKLESITPDDAATEDAKPYLNLTSNKMLLPRALNGAVEKLVAPQSVQPVLTYLANRMRVVDAEGKPMEGHDGVPYSTITGIDFATTPPLGPFVDEAGQAVEKLRDDEIALVDWAAKDLQAKLGDRIEVQYFEPESAHGTTRETSAVFTLKAVIKLSGPANDRQLTPDFPGVTDKLSIGDWRPPFPYNPKRIRSQDEDYWDEYGPTPKAYVSLAAGQKLWRSRFGNLTGLRIALPADQTAEQFAEKLADELSPAEMGLAFSPVKRLGLAASSGTTPFDALFLGFSMFIIAAALMLVSLLFRLGVEGRADEVGLLLACGMKGGQVVKLLAFEGLLISAIGAAVGEVLGVGYAWLMLAALRSPDWWLAAVNTPFLHLDWTYTSLVLGYVLGVLTSYAAIYFSVRRLKKSSIRQLLAGDVSGPVEVVGQKSKTTFYVSVASLILAVLLIPVGTQLTAEAQAGAFMGSGALILAALLAHLQGRLKSAVSSQPLFSSGLAMTRLAFRNGSRNPARSVLTMGLVASATFLILAISAFRIDTSNLQLDPASGNGGFSLVGQSDRPLFYNLNEFATPEGRQHFNVQPSDIAGLPPAQVYSLRVRPGTDASCLNLYQTTADTGEGSLVQARVLGLPADLIQRGGFAWGGSLAETEAEQANPWLLLEKKLPNDEVPVVLDFATAQYSLHVNVGSTMQMQNDAGEKLTLKVVGLLKNSILQGDVLMAESNFVRQFPDYSGYRFFLIQTTADAAPTVARAMERNQTLGDLGFRTESANARLAGFLAVQNTYLSTFQSLGGLGLLLGTLGLAAVQLRNILERRRELALLQAIGLRRAKLAWLVLIENFWLLVGGLLLGLISALVALIPHLFSGGAGVPWVTLLSMLGTIFLVGLIASQSSVRAVLAMPLLPALKGE